MYKHGENQALNVSQQVVFRNVVRDNTTGNITSQEIIPIQRNHLYKVILTPKYNNGALVFGEMDYAIQVNDWQTGETLVFAGDEKLTAQSTPSFTVSGALIIGGTETDGVTNPTSIIAGLNDHSIYLTVTSQTTGTMLESATFPSTQYGLVSSSTTNDANGNLVEVYKIDIDENIQRLEDHTFTLSNAINTSLARTFVLKKIDPRLNPLWWVSKGNVNSYNANSSGEYTIGTPMQRGYYMKHSTAMTKFSAYKNQTAYTGWKSAGVKGTDGNLYHLPTVQEWKSISPIDVKNSDGTGRASFMKESDFNSNKIITEGTVNFGFSDVTRNTGVVVKSYWKPAVHDTVRYAIRYLGEIYCSVWRYTYNNEGNFVQIRSKLIPVLSADNTNANKTVLSAYLQDIIDNHSDWREWTDNGEDKIVRTFHTEGCMNNSAEGTTPRSPGEKTCYFIVVDNGSKWTASFESITNLGGYFNFGEWWDKYGMMPRLFRDE